jgi:dolichol-phosphate mannosyltransferase
MHIRQDLPGEPPEFESCRHGQDDTWDTVSDLTVIVPTCNEKTNVRPLVEQLCRVLDGHDAEIFFVDDSTDDTPGEIAAVAAAAAVPVHLIHRPAGQRIGGLAGAVVAGVRASSGEYVVVMDGDLQHPPDMVPLLRRAVAGVDVAVASRYADEGDPSGLSGSYRRIVSGGSTLLARTCFPRRVGRTCSDPMTGFFCFRRVAVDLSRMRPRGFKILLEILVRHDLRVREVPFLFGERAGGVSKASWRHGLHFMCQIIGLRMGRMGGFAAVGALGTVVNLAMMAVLIHGLFDLDYVVASIVAAEVSILHNYVLQERFVFRDLRAAAGDWHIRLGQHLLLNNVEALVRLPFLILLVENLSFDSVLAQATTLAMSFILRFLLVTRVVYRVRPGRAASRGPLAARRIHHVAAPGSEEVAA